MFLLLVCEGHFADNSMFAAASDAKRAKYV
jgi:hypothetical protein